ncbi:hypothetical protein [Effusibacillus consociatus]|uniref:Uncharacterized protein n=1 Tax=Effusibacillus consociatus TaxID=1117041 RepID=A0ABV9Q5E7_9BACL
MSEQKIPKTLEGRKDLKALTINLFGGLMKSIQNGTESLPAHPDHSAIIVTNFGIITADVEHIDTEELGTPVGADQMKLNTINMLVKFRDEALKEWENEIGPENARLTNDTSIVLLKNATLRPFANPEARFDFDQLALFADQIVGFTGGESSE